VPERVKEVMAEWKTKKTKTETKKTKKVENNKCYAFGRSVGQSHRSVE
jgi:hypothetical protein